MKVYKYRNSDSRSIDMVLNNEIYASPFSKLNDPHEATYNESITLIANMLEKVFKTDSTDFKNSFKEIEAYKSNLGIYSLSYKYSLKKMWSEYADLNKGFCIEYDIEKLQDLHSGVVKHLNVKYKYLPPIVGINDIGNQISLLTKLFGTKTLKWSYEKETRLIYDDHGKKKYHPSALTAIYFGTQMSAPIRKKIIDSLDNRDVKFYEIIKKPYSLRLERKLLHENMRKLAITLENDSFKILKTRHSSLVENFYVLYKSSQIIDESLKTFFNGFREKFATKNCSIYLFDDISIIGLIDKTLEGKDYIKFADHYFAASYYDTPEIINRYPNKDFQYNEYGGNI